MRDDPVESLALLPITAIVAPSRRAWRERVFAPITVERCQQTQHELTGAAALNLYCLLLVVLSCVIATFGLIANSAAVIIGAMLTAPLMTPILADALALLRSLTCRWSASRCAKFRVRMRPRRSGGSSCSSWRMPMRTIAW